MKIEVIAHANARIKKIEIRDNVYHIYVRAKPIEGEANQALIEALGSYFSKPKSTIVLLRGHTSKKKLFEIKE